MSIDMFFWRRPFTGPLHRGLFRYLVLYLLKEKPMHGYAIMNAMKELFMGYYMPSPGILYPTLQILEKNGLIEGKIDEDKRIYKITNKGLDLLRKHEKEVQKVLNIINRFKFFMEIGGGELLEVIMLLFRDYDKLSEKQKDELKEAFIGFRKKLLRILFKISEEERHERAK